MIYLDYAANTPVDPEVLEAFCRVERRSVGNPNSRHQAGQAAGGEMAEITGRIAGLLGAKPAEIIHTSGASEANNLALKGMARAYRHTGKHIISSVLEHPSASGALTSLQEQGWEIDLVDVRRDGAIDLEHLRELLRKDTVILSLCLVDSELGTVQPVERIAEVLREYPNCHFHVDAVQAAGKVPFTLEGIDTLTLSAHKIHGLNGCGLLYKREGVMLEPLIHGGAGATIYRSGTPAVALAASMEAALQKALEQREARAATVSGLRERLLRELGKYPEARVNSTSLASPYILNLSVKGVKGEAFVGALNERGVCVSQKSACSAPGTPSRPVMAVTGDRKNGQSSWRISLSHLTTDAELDEFMVAFASCFRELNV